jgi:uncharacterized protein YbjT (DUF2867 family)
MIGVIGGSGNIGAPTIRNLVKRGASLRALTSSSNSAERLKALGVSEVVVGDFRNGQDLRRVFQDCVSIFHVIPPFTEEEVEIGFRVIAAAREAGVEHIVFNSVFHPQMRKMDHHARKLLVEEAVIESGLAFNIIQPAMLMQNVQGVWRKIRSEGIYPALASPDKKLCLIDAEDLGEAIAKVLIDPGLRGAIFELAGPDALTFMEMAAVISEELNRPVQVKPLDENQRKAFASSQGWGKDASKAFLSMCRHYDDHGFPGGNPLMLTALLGRPPGTYRSFIRRLIATDAFGAA